MTTAASAQRAPLLPMPARAIEPPGPRRVAWRTGAAQLRGSSLVFIGLLLLLTLEYTGLPNEVVALKVTKFATLLAYGLFAFVVARVGVTALMRERQVKLLAVFFVWTVLSIAWAVVRTYTMDSLRPQLDDFVLLALAVYVLDRPSRIFTTAGVFAGLAAVVVIRNITQLSSAVRAGAFKAGYFMGDGNDFAWGLNVLLPLCLALAVCQRRVIGKLVGLGGAAVCIFGIIGTQSRGGALGMAVAFLYAWLFVARRKALGAIVLAAALVGGVVMAPSGYFSRLQTVTALDQDNSAQGRFQAWAAALRMARDYPLGVGAGNFNSAYGRWYNPSTTGEGTARIDYGSARWISAHSIYFKTIAEYGFGGLALLLWLIVTSFVENVRSRARLLEAPDGAPFDPRWPGFINMSILAYAVSGIFLGGIWYPHIFLLSGLTIGLKRIIALEYAEGQAAVPAVAAAPVAEGPESLGPRPALPTVRDMQQALMARHRR